MIEIDVIQVGVLATNCFVVRAPGNSECILIDPGSDPDRIIGFLDSMSLVPVSILATHAHGDHTGAATPLADKYGCEFMIGAGDVDAAADQLDWLKSMLGDFVEPPKPTKALEHGDLIDKAGVEIKVLSTPGHTGGSSSFCVDGGVFTGDTLFRETIGRFDLSDGDQHQEIASIQNELFALPDETVVYPGHGPYTSIGHEKANNRYVR